MQRCPWCGEDPLYTKYHDEEWGVPVHDDRVWFEFLLLEGAQAGLSWITILRKREAYRKAYDGFDPVKAARYTEKQIEKLMRTEGIIRNRRKIESSIANAKAFLKVQRELGSFDAYMWSFVGDKPIMNAFRSISEIPARTPLSERMSEDLRGRGFSFVGPTICYAHMQATGMVNDHLVDCFRYHEICPSPKKKRAGPRPS